AGFTAPGVLVGTVQYMSPEQLCGGRPAMSWDLWASAVVAYEALTGAYPFKPSANWRQAIVEGHVISRRVHVPDATAGWDAFFAQALSADSVRRPPNAAAFAADFTKVFPEATVAASTRPQ